MIWNGALRLHMNDSIQRAIAPFLNAIRSRPDAAFPATLIRSQHRSTTRCRTSCA